jgi:hypothetical protein
MKLYRLHRTYEHGSSAGFEWFTRKDEAEKAGRVWVSDDGQTTKEQLLDGLGHEIDRFDFTLTKAAVLELLTTCATHPDNG